MTPTVGIQAYVWIQIFEAGGQALEDHLDEAVASVVASGITTFEPGLPTESFARRVGEVLPRHGVTMPTMYAGGTLHTPEWQAGVEHVLARARWGKAMGARTVVVNPNPIQWGEPLNKSDEELTRQARALQLIGERVRAEGMVLAYHTHDAEMRCAAREFHHMMRGTDPSVVGMCLDAHWIYRGAGNSQVALFDVVGTYIDRIKTVHLRQSQGGVWCEVLGDGDIDYRALAKTLQAAGFDGPLVMEQCFEPGTPSTLSPTERHRRGKEWVETTFGA